MNLQNLYFTQHSLKEAHGTIGVLRIIYSFAVKFSISALRSILIELDYFKKDIHKDTLYLGSGDLFGNDLDHHSVPDLNVVVHSNFDVKVIYNND